jgi:rSAM/selenodomain-associated transferase 1
MSRTTEIAVLAKAPIPGLAKTRLMPALGAHGAAALQDLLTERAVATACVAGTVTLWGTPDITHRSFRDLVTQYRVRLRRQPDGDLGARMLAALTALPGGGLVIGTDCPALTADHLRRAAAALADHDVVLIPAEDGGYVLIGMRAPQPGLFDNMVWSTDTVLAETRARIARLGLTCFTLEPLWDVDRPEDLSRLSPEEFGAFAG